MVRRWRGPWRPRKPAWKLTGSSVGLWEQQPIREVPTYLRYVPKVLPYVPKVSYVPKVCTLQ